MTTHETAMEQAVNAVFADIHACWVEFHKYVVDVDVLWHWRDKMYGSLSPFFNHRADPNDEFVQLLTNEYNAKVVVFKAEQAAQAGKEDDNGDCSECFAGPDDEHAPYCPYNDDDA